MDGPDRLPPPNPEKAATMRRYDALPPATRRAISSAAFQIHPQAAEKMLGRGMTGERCAENLTRTDPHRPDRAGGRR
ncbi:DUF6525 family protein [Agrobacterium salinitolerans]|uniref:DUF6525 family protein n=1 Tax=Agrobacterium salinitolerans TaxID=1183413 RepID=UPI003872B852